MKTKSKPMTPKGRKQPKSTAKAADRLFAQAKPKLAEDQALVDEVQRLTMDFTQQVQATAERRGISVDVIVQVSPRKA